MYLLGLCCRMQRTCHPIIGSSKLKLQLKSFNFIVIAVLFSIFTLTTTVNCATEDNLDPYSDQFADEENVSKVQFDNNDDPFGSALFPHDEEYDDEDEDSKDDSENDERRSSDDSCLTKECIMASANILSTLNNSADPCDDFYNYVCGKFPVTHEPFADSTRTMSFEMKRRKNSFLMHKILQKMVYDNELKSFDKLKAAYDSCMNENHMDRYGIADIKKILARYGPWPLDRSSWDEKTWNFKNRLNNIVVNLPVKAFFSLTVLLDPKNESSYTLSVVQQGLYLPREYYISKKKQEKHVRKVYFDMMLKIMTLFGYNRGNMSEDIQKVLNFEIKLAKVFLPKSSLRKTDKVYKKMSLKELGNLNPEIKWKDLVKKMFHLVKFKDYSNQRIVIYGEQYLKNLGTLIRNTDKKTLANYIMWRIVSRFLPFAGKKIRDVKFKFLRLFSGKKAPSPNWLNCVNTVDSWMPFAYGRLYVDNVFKSRYAKKEASDMISRLKEAFIHNLKDVKWMNENTKQRARSKALSIIKLIGYPSYILDDNKLDKQYSEVLLNKDDFLGNFLKMHQFDSKVIFKRLKQKRDRREWLSHPAAVNAFYSARYNRIVLPAGILGPFFYHHGYPPSLKFGGIGTVIGHELSHAFDDEGRKYDEKGRLIQWWDSSVIKNFKKIADCIRAQYSSYKIYGRHMNGNLSCGENMADNGGVKLAYNAYKAYTEEYPYQKRLPGLEHLTHDQLFFIAFAKIWCLIESEASVIKRIFTDPHSYPPFRVKGSLSNSADFARAFRCPIGSTMNPKKKCKFW